MRTTRILEEQHKEGNKCGVSVITFAQRDDVMLETLIASLGVMSMLIIVMSSIDRWKASPLYSEQNIYTNPQSVAG